ncbi:MAG: hypothetical protein KGR26_05820 [Cyanobacteria bacterium REEB65]|nr:hypothetical protein [Cyanobacteria bacterium REEB65]
MPLVLDAACPDIPPPAMTEIVPVGPHSDPAGALAPIEPRIRELASDAWATTITDQTSLQAAADLLAEIKGLAKQIDGLKAVFVTPLETAAKRAKNVFKPLSGLLDAAEKRIKDATKAYLELQRARGAQVATARKAVAILSAATPEAAAAIAIEPLFVAPPPKAAGVSMAWRWTYEVQDIKALARAVADGTAPETYVQVGGGAIQCAIRSGVREIPGLRIFQQGDVISR